VADVPRKKKPDVRKLPDSQAGPVEGTPTRGPIRRILPVKRRRIRPAESPGGAVDVPVPTQPPDEQQPRDMGLERMPRGETAPAGAEPLPPGMEKRLKRGRPLPPGIEKEFRKGPQGEPPRALPVESTNGSPADETVRAVAERIRAGKRDEALKLVKKRIAENAARQGNVERIRKLAGRMLGGGRHIGAFGRFGRPGGPNWLLPGPGGGRRGEKYREYIARKKQNWREKTGGE